MKVDWVFYNRHYSFPPVGRYWLVIKASPDGYARPRVVIGERVYDSRGDLFRTDDLGGCDDLVIYYAVYEDPELPEGI